MDRATLLTILQGLGIALQMVNAQIAVLTHSTSEALIISAFIGGYQYVIQHLGNTTPVPPAPKNLVVESTTMEAKNKAVIGVEPKGQ